MTNKRDAKQMQNAMFTMFKVCERQSRCENCPAREICSGVKDLHFDIYPPKEWRFEHPAANF